MKSKPLVYSDSEDTEETEESVMEDTSEHGELPCKSTSSDDSTETPEVLFNTTFLIISSIV